jgi:hypothetical protein
MLDPGFTDDRYSPDDSEMRPHPGGRAVILALSIALQTARLGWIYLGPLILNLGDPIPNT